MTYKTILVQCDAGKANPKCLSVAVDLAQRFAARLVALHARAPFEMPTFYEDGFSMGPMIEAYEARLKAEERFARRHFEEAVKGKALASRWLALDGRVEDLLALEARYADLVVVGQSGPDNAFTTPPELPERVAMSSGRPTLVVPYIGTAKTIGNKVLLCWNASRESARAAADAMPLLKAASQVIVLTVQAKASREGSDARSGADLASWLAAQGVKATVEQECAADVDVGNVILSRAADHDIDLLVMGIYGHSRLREWALGGASRTILDTMTVPVLMSH